VIENIIQKNKDILIVIAHYNTYRLSPFFNTWQETIFKCMEKFPSYNILFIDWNSLDESDKSTEQLCSKLGYYYRKVDNLPFPKEQFFWHYYFKRTIEIIKEYNYQYILYVEADTYICGDEKQLNESLQILVENKNICSVVLNFLFPNGIRPRTVEKKIRNGYLLPQFENYRHYRSLNPDINDQYLDGSKFTRRLWNNWDIKCSLFKVDYLDNIINSSEYIGTKSSETFKKSFFYFGRLLNQKYRSSAGEYLFACNYGGKSQDNYKKVKNICEKYKDFKLIDFCTGAYLDINNCIFQET
jgi:hypothetical protein